jgi:hypothetical protein
MILPTSILLAAAAGQSCLHERYAAAAAALRVLLSLAAHRGPSCGVWAWLAEQIQAAAEWLPAFVVPSAAATPCHRQSSSASAWVTCLLRVGSSPCRQAAAAADAHE